MRRKVSQKRFIKAVEDTGGILSLIAKKLNVSRQTIHTFVNNNPEMSEILVQEREKIIDLGEASLFAQVKAKQAWATKFLLTTIGKGRGYFERSEIEGSINLFEEERKRITETLKQMREEEEDGGERDDEGSNQDTEV